MMFCVSSHKRPVYFPKEPQAPKVVYVENKSNTLNILLFCHASDYFMYRGTTVGFQYELLKTMCDSLHKECKFTFVTDIDSVTKHFFTSDFDIIAFDVDPSAARMSELLFSESHSTSHPVLLQHRRVDLAEAQVVWQPEYYHGRVCMDSFPETTSWSLQSSDSLSAEELVELLQDDSITNLVTDYNTAIMLDPFYSDLKIIKAVGPEYERRWILNPANVSKNDSINQWLRDYKQTEKYAKLCDKYFHPRSRYILNSSTEKRRGKISSMDAVMRRYGTKLGIDWRFVSSIIRQESGFRADLVGVGGSFGVMQMMPATAANFGITDTSSVEQQIYAGMRLIKQLDNILSKYVPDADERLYFVAAAYNSGSGHVVDACELCIKYGGDVTSWSDVSEYLILKKEHKYYTDPVVKCGYYPGRHTVQYVDAVMNRYLGYKVSLNK